MLRVAFSGVFAARLAEPVRKRLTLPCDVSADEGSGIFSRLAELDVLVTMAFTREMAAAAGRLKLVQVPGASLDRIDRAALGPGTWLANAYGHEVGIAEYVMGAMLALNRGFCRMDARLRRGEWESQWAIGVAPPAPWTELAGQTLGILGYGRIGQAVAQRARAFGMRILGIRRAVGRSTEDDLALLGGLEKLDAVLAESDYLVVALSLTEATRNLLGARELRLMKPSAILINVARAEIIEEKALYEALAQRVIAAAALDVWYRYPTGPGPTVPAQQAFHELPNVLMTPHVSGWTEGMMEARTAVIVENIQRAARGEPPINLIDG